MGVIIEVKLIDEAAKFRFCAAEAWLSNFDVEVQGSGFLLRRLLGVRILKWLRFGLLIDCQARVSDFIIPFIVDLQHFGKLLLRWVLLVADRTHLMCLVCGQALQYLLLVHLPVNFLNRIRNFVLVLLHQTIKLVIFGLFVCFYFAIISILFHILVQRWILNLKFFAKGIHCGCCGSSCTHLFGAILHESELSGWSAV